MKRIVAFLMSFACLFFCACNNNVAESSDSERTTDTSTNEETAWEPDLYQSWNYDPAFPSGDYLKMYDFGDPSTYDIDFHLETDTFSASDFPEKVSVIIENRNGTPFVLKLSNLFLFEKKYTLPDDIRPNTDDTADTAEVNSRVNDVWVRLPTIYANSNAAWLETARADLNHTTDIRKYVNSDYVFTPGEYRLVFYTLAGAHYAYFTVTE